jgi:hypothetical protein
MKYLGIFLVIMALWFLEPYLGSLLAFLNITGWAYKALYLGFFVAGGVIIGAIWNPNPH